MKTQLNALQLFVIAGALAQAIATQNAAGGDNKTKRANAIKIVLQTVSSVIPEAASHPEFAEHIGLLIDDFVGLQKKLPAPAPVVNESQSH
jgi:hypothetical protein